MARDSPVNTCAMCAKCLNWVVLVTGNSCHCSCFQTPRPPVVPSEKVFGVDDSVGSSRTEPSGSVRRVGVGKMVRSFKIDALKIRSKLARNLRGTSENQQISSKLDLFWSQDHILGMQKNCRISA